MCGDWVSQSTPSTLGHVIRASRCGEWLHNSFHPGSSFFFFLMWTIFKVFIHFVTILLLFYVLTFWP